MSTKAIREALDILEDLVRTNVGHDVVKRATAEVEAIEKAAASVVDAKKTGTAQGRYVDAMGLFERIAKEAPWAKDSRHTRQTDGA